MNLLERASKYVAAMPPAISGSGGHSACFAVAVALVHGFDLNEEESWPILLAYNERCEPPWSERELRHKLTSAGAVSRHPKPRGHLRGCGGTAGAAAVAEVRIRKVRWQDMVARLAGGPAPQRPAAARPAGPPEPPFAPPQCSQLIATAQRILNAELLPDDEPGTDVGLPGDEPGCTMRERLAMIDAILGQRDARGRSNYTASQIEACAIGLRRHAGTHPDIDAMLHRLNEAEAMALGWRELVRRWRG